METLLLLMDSIAMALLLYYSRTNDKLKPGEPETGFFRYKETVVAKQQAASRGRGRTRS